MVDFYIAMLDSLSGRCFESAHSKLFRQYHTVSAYFKWQYPMDSSTSTKLSLKDNFSTPPTNIDGTTHTLPQTQTICRIFLWLAIWLQNFCSILNSPVPHEILRAHRTFVQRKVWKCFPLGDGKLSGVRLRSFNMASPHTEAHSQLGTNSGASALKDAAETPPLGPFAWDKMFLAEDTSKASRFQTH